MECYTITIAFWNPMKAISVYSHAWDFPVCLLRTLSRLSRLSPQPHHLPALYLTHSHFLVRLVSRFEAAFHATSCVLSVKYHNANLNGLHSFRLWSIIKCSIHTIALAVRISSTFSCRCCTLGTYQNYSDSVLAEGKRRVVAYTYVSTHVNHESQEFELVT